MSRKRGGAVTSQTAALAQNAQPAALAQNAQPDSKPLTTEEEQENYEAKQQSKDTLAGIQKMMPFPYNFVLNPLIGVGVKSVNNYRLVKRLIKSVTLKRNKHELEYGNLTNDGISNFELACELIYKFYPPDIGKQYDFFRISKEIHNSCVEHRTLDKQYNLFHSTDETKQKRLGFDFENVFNSEPSKFQNLYNMLLKDPNFKSVELNKMNYESQDVIHSKIENLFVYNNKNCAYLITYLMHDMVIRIEKLNESIKKGITEHSNTGYMNEAMLLKFKNKKYVPIDDECDSVNSFMDLLYGLNLTSAVESVMKLQPGKIDEKIVELKKEVKEEAAKKAAAANASLPGAPSLPTAPSLPGAPSLPSTPLPATKGGSRLTRRYKRSKRIFPKKRRLTTRRVKVIK